MTLRRKSTTSMDETDNLASKKQKEDEFSPKTLQVWSIVIPRLGMAEQVLLSGTCSTLREKTAAVADQQLRDVTKKLLADINQ